MSGPLKVIQPDLVCLSGTSSSEVEGGTRKHDTEILMINSHMEVSTNTDVMSTQNTDTEERYPCETTSNHEDCSTSGISQPEISNVLQRNRSRGIGERNKRKRWRGRHEDSDFIPEVISGSSKQDLNTTMVTSSPYMSREQQVLIIILIFHMAN